MISVSVEKKFRELFGKAPMLFRSPGRINLIGEHTDYNDGFVLPAAIDKEAIFAIGLNNSDKIRMHAYDLGQDYVTSSDNLQKSKDKWPDYLSGVIDQMTRAMIQVPGFDCVFGSDIPIGAGLSSSAAIECGLAYGLNELLGLGIEKMDLTRMALRAEQEFAGLNCGIMDQFANLHGKKGHVIKLDCRSLEYEYYPLELPEYDIILCDTRVKHSLASSEYNTRRAECEEGVRIFRENKLEVKSLRDADSRMLNDLKGQFPVTVFKRCHYVIHEIGRVELACHDLQVHDIAKFGSRMYETHEGLSKEYEVSCPELDFLVSQARENSVTGARMMGGGFGGCTINLVGKTVTENFLDKTIRAFHDKFGYDPEIYRVSVNDGTSMLEPA